MSRVLSLIESLSGAVIAYAGTSAPTGWLLCDGSVKLRADYPALFLAIGTTYATGGETGAQFRLPDMRGRVVAGLDNMGGTAANRLTNTGTGAPSVSGATLGASGGTDRHTITVAQMPSHSHAQVASGNSSGGASGNPMQSNTSSGTNIAGTTQAAGTGEAHPIVQPTLVLNYLIKT
ncbi:MAG TPA: tail fiber protein [Pyrinomonadaceae bacterium]|nr:tail fiber protein [Pyrinomonadaceae bacterium]